jgi:phospholipid-binding lipoprotein MlaA
MKNEEQEQIVTISLKKSIFLIFIMLGLCACASSPHTNKADPYEGFNRVAYGFNDGLDKFLIKPIAQSYHFLLPDVIETSVGNFFSNLGEIRNLANSGLQAKGGKALIHTGRFLVNSTAGLLGFIDTAHYVGLKKPTSEDFGQTLAVWGVGSGPYIVLPLFGPSTIRDGLGFPVDSFLNPVTYVDHIPTRNSLGATSIIDTRAGFLSAEKLIRGDRYVFIRDAYLQRREFLINDGEVKDSFSGSLEGNGDF